jgi:hypothetical protein
MNNIACIYFEGNDSKIALFEKENGQLKLLKAESIDTSLAFSEQKAGTANKSNGSNKPKDKYEYNFVLEESTTFNRTFLQKLNNFFVGEDLSKCKFIPILSEPAVYFQKVNDEKDLASLNINPKGKIETTIDFVELYDESKLAVYPSGQSSYLQAIDALARMNNRKFFKIPTVKSAEISLAYYVSRKRKFQDKEISLIVYVGKEYSKLIFLNGDKLFHIGTTLSVGKNSFNAHNVIVSKILLEMEHASISNIDNIIVCGEDETEDLILTVSEAYPKATVTVQSIESVEIQGIDSFSTEASFIIPAAVAEEYYAELDKEMEGINLLPGYIKEEQRIFHIGWQGYLMMVLIVLSAAFFLNTIFSNINSSKEKDREIGRLLVIQAQNKETVDKIKSYESKIQNVDQTKATLNQLSSGTGILSVQMKKLANFANQKRNMWMNKLTVDKQKNVKLGGFTFSRIIVKELSDSYNGSILESILYEPLRDTRTFKFSIDAGNLMGGVKNEEKK